MNEPMWCGCGDGIVADSGAKCGTCAFTDLLHCEADAARYRWLRDNVDETPVRPAAYGAVNFPDMRLKFTLPDLLSFADYMGQRTFDEAVDAAMERCGDGSPARQGAEPDGQDLNPDLSASASPATKEQQ